MSERDDFVPYPASTPDGLDEHLPPKPTPALLRAWADDFFDNPNASPPMTIDVYSRSTPGFLLRRIADAMERAYNGETGGEK